MKIIVELPGKRRGYMFLECLKPVQSFAVLYAVREIDDKMYLPVRIALENVLFSTKQELRQVVI